MGTKQAAVLAAALTLASACSGTVELSGPSTSAAAATTTATATPNPPAASIVAADTIATTTSTTTAEASHYLFALSPTEVLTIGEAEWEAGFVGPGTVLRHDGQIHMFYTGFPVGAGGPVAGIGHATSRDGVNFFRESDEPLFERTDVPYVDPIIGFVVPHSALVLSDGTWVIYFSTTGHEGRPASSVIGRATAPAPSGPWAIDEQPILEAGPAGAWDALSVANPSVLATDSGFTMWYDGDNGDLDQRPSRDIGMATSDDGISWTKYDDPATTDGRYAASDPVFERDENAEAWDHLRVTEPTVYRTGDTFVMMYASDRRLKTELERRWEFGYARSADGVTWERPAEDSVWSSGGDTFSRMFSPVALAFPDGTLRIYVGTQSGVGRATVVRAIEFSGELP